MDKLSEEEQIWYADFIDTELCRSSNDEYDKEDMKMVYENNNASGRCMLSNAYKEECPSVLHDGEVLSNGHGFDDILLDLQNLTSEDKDVLYGQWQISFDIAYDNLMSHYSKTLLSNEELLVFYAKLSQLMKWERVQRRNET